jgi:hypothetical protein
LKGHESSKLPGLAHLSTPPTWSGEPEHWKGTSPPRYPAQPTFLRLQLGRRARVLKEHESSKLPGSAHLSAPTLGRGGGGGRHWKGTSPPSYPAQPTFCIFNLVRQARVSEGHRVLQTSWLSPPFCAINLDNLSGLAPFQEGRTLDSMMTTSSLQGHLVTHQRLLRLHN